jgi:hypothetical protein
MPATAAGAIPVTMPASLASSATQSSQYLRRTGLSRRPADVHVDGEGVDDAKRLVPGPAAALDRKERSNVRRLDGVPLPGEQGVDERVLQRRRRGAGEMAIVPSLPGRQARRDIDQRIALLDQPGVSDLVRDDRRVRPGRDLAAERDEVHPRREEVGGRLGEPAPQVFPGPVVHQELQGQPERFQIPDEPSPAAPGVSGIVRISSAVERSSIADPPAALSHVREDDTRTIGLRSLAPLPADGTRPGMESPSVPGIRFFARTPRGCRRPIREIEASYPPGTVRRAAACRDAPSVRPGAGKRRVAGDRESRILRTVTAGGAAVPASAETGSRPHRAERPGAGEPGCDRQTGEGIRMR